MFKGKTNMKRMIIMFCLLFCCSIVTACGNRADKNGSKISDDGRSYGGLIKGKTGEVIETAFFDMTVKEAVRYNTYQFDDGLYQAEEGNTYLVVTLTVENTYDEDIPMSITDFTLDYKGNQSKGIITGYGKADLKNESFMDNIFTLKKGESITKSILFTVRDKEDYTLNYAEYYEDEFKGDSFSVSLTPPNSSVEKYNSTTEQITEENATEE